MLYPTGNNRKGRWSMTALFLAALSLSSCSAQTQDAHKTNNKQTSIGIATMNKDGHCSPSSFYLGRRIHRRSAAFVLQGPQAIF